MSARLDPFNPATAKPDDFKMEAFPLVPNISRTEAIQRTQAKAWWGENWYPQLSLFGLTPESTLINLTDEQAAWLISLGDLSLDEAVLDATRRPEMARLIYQLMAAIMWGHTFVRSSAKSSHSRRPAQTLRHLIEELTSPPVIMSFKYGCRHVFLREWVDSIRAEYRVYIHAGKVRYIEEYVPLGPETGVDRAQLKQDLVDYALRAASYLSNLPDLTIDIGLRPADPESCPAFASRTELAGFELFVIEVNTPLWLFAGLMCGKYAWDRDRIHQAEEPIFRYRQDGEIEEL